MILARRAFLTGLIAAPLVVRTPGLLMPVKRVVTREEWLTEFSEEVRRAYGDADQFFLIYVKPEIERILALPPVAFAA